MPTDQRLRACPVDGTILIITDRKGIEIDYCPSCHGIWLDRMELDKILASQAPSPLQIGSSQPHAYGEKPGGYRKSFLEELFD